MKCDREKIVDVVIGLWASALRLRNSHTKLLCDTVENDFDSVFLPAYFKNLAHRVRPYIDLELILQAEANSSADVPVAVPVPASAPESPCQTQTKACLDVEAGTVSV